MTWKHFAHCWPFVMLNHRPQVWHTCNVAWSRLMQSNGVYDNVMTWKRLSHYCSLVEGKLPWWLTKGQQYATLFVVGLDKVLNKRLSSRWFATPCHLSDVTAWWDIDRDLSRLASNSVGKWEQMVHGDKMGEQENFKIRSRADSRYAPSQWETSLQSNTVTHWLAQT